jgi:hypothetical protein
MPFRAFQFVLAAALLMAPNPSVGGPAEGEDELKSVIVKNFLRYSTWPESALPAGPIIVGVIGRPSFAQVLHGLLDGKPVNGRLVQTVELKPGSDARQCQLIYIATDKSSEIKQILAGVRAARTLAIGETDKFLEYGGAVNLLLLDGHMGFEVSLEALDRTGIEISSKLLRLGQVKRRRPE